MDFRIRLYHPGLFIQSCSLKTQSIFQISLKIDGEKQRQQNQQRQIQDDSDSPAKCSKIQ